MCRSGLFLLNSLWVHVNILISSFRGLALKKWYPFRQVHLWVTYLAHLHSSLTIFIYGLTNPVFRATCKRLLLCRCNDRNIRLPAGRYIISHCKGYLHSCFSQTLAMLELLQTWFVHVFTFFLFWNQLIELNVKSEIKDYIPRLHALLDHFVFEGIAKRKLVMLALLYCGLCEKRREWIVASAETFKMKFFFFRKCSIPLSMFRWIIT